MCDKRNCVTMMWAMKRNKVINVRSKLFLGQETCCPITSTKNLTIWPSKWVQDWPIRNLKMWWNVTEEVYFLRVPHPHTYIVCFRIYRFGRSKTLFFVYEWINLDNVFRIVVLTIVVKKSPHIIRYYIYSIIQQCLGLSDE
jgi:hypothetical protein